MDTLSHTLWGLGLFGYRGHPYLALLFGAFPDLVSFGLWPPWHFLSNGFSTGMPSLEALPDWVYLNYNAAHSLLVAASAIALVGLWRRDLAFVMLGWPVHILLDAPFHTADFFPTRLFWPLSDTMIDGISWDTPWVWFGNIAALALLFLWRWLDRASRR